MSNSPEPELDLDLHFLPAWAQESPSFNRYAKYEGGAEERPERRGGRPDRPRDRRDRPPRREGERGRGERPGRPDHGRPRRDDRGPARPQPGRFEPPKPVAPLPQFAVALLPEEKGVESLAKQIKLTGRAYPLFDIGRLILQKSDRYLVRFSVVKKPDGQVAQPLFVCNLDETLWMSEDDAVAHVLAKHFATFYQAERIATEAPKGTYTFVAQCGLSGTILGPPNYHDYQSKLRKLHAERFAHMPLEAFKSRVRIVRDEAVVKKWLEEQSFKNEFTCLNIAERKKLQSREEVERHFREVHRPNVVQSVESYTLSGPAAHNLPCHPLRSLVRHAVEDQQRFPLRIVNVLSQQFATHALQFFKVNKTVTHVAVARPHYLDLAATPVSEGCQRIIEFINAHANSTRRELLASLAPTPTPAPAAPSAPAPTETPLPSETPAPEQVAAAAETHQPTPEQATVIGDLHWLIHQGHVIEFANGRLETAKPPAPKPVKPTPPSTPGTAPAPTPTVSSEPVVPASTELASAPATSAPAEPTTSAEPSAEPAPVAEPLAPPAVPVALEPAVEQASTAPEPALEASQQPAPA
ncbi:MAG: hypothetical protein HYY24_28260 [Verrucomicrobia bacterium]|nr:hypothetical protein [Verrucomicrobiota bacterium]